MVVCWVIAAVLLITNVAGYFLVRYDKRAAQSKRRAEQLDRVPERTFHLIAALGGWPLEVVAMRQVRHKTRKRSFQVGMVLASLLGTLGWFGWALALGCLAPFGLGL